MPIGHSNIHIHINVSELIKKSVSLVFREFNRIASRNKGKTIILVRSSFQIIK